MGWLVNGFKAVFGVGQSGSDNVMKVASGVGGWIDNLNYTDEEKAKANANTVTSLNKFFAMTVDENSERSRTRREIAIWVIRVELGMLVGSVIAFKFDSELSKYMYQVATDSPLGLLTLGVGALFFGTHMLRSAKKD